MAYFLDLEQAVAPAHYFYIFSYSSLFTATCAMVGGPSYSDVAFPEKYVMENFQEIFC